MTLSEIYTAQGYIDPITLAEKRENNDYTIYVAAMQDDDNTVYMCVDGNHSLKAAQIDGIEPVIVEVPTDHKTVEAYVIAMNDLDNPVNVVTGKCLW